MGIARKWMLIFYYTSLIIRKIVQRQTSPQRDIFLHTLIWKNEETFSFSKLRDGAEMADSWGTERAGETNVSRPLRHIGSTPAPRKAAIGAQSKSGSFSTHLSLFSRLLRAL